METGVSKPSLRRSRELRLLPDGPSTTLPLDDSRAAPTAIPGSNPAAGNGVLSPPSTPARPAAAGFPTALCVIHTAAPQRGNAAQMASHAEAAEVLPYFTALTTYFSYGLLYVFGHLRDAARQAAAAVSASLGGRRAGTPGLAPLTSDFEDFYTRRLYYRIQDCFNRPIASAPDAWIDVCNRASDDGQKSMYVTPGTKKCLNLGSYNYLGFAASDAYCTDRVSAVLAQYGASCCSPRADAGTTPEHLELESLVARFVGKPAALVYGMGFATNSTALPALAGRGALVISDALNHSSIVAGVRLTGAKVKVFQHNDPKHLEAVLRTAIAEGQPRTHRPWTKILIVVEGIYSMEGEVCRLAEIVAIKKAYRAYLYLDEAHSIGALGRTGRGACEHCGVDPADVDILMGTFTKSFGSAGGYIAASAEIVQYLRLQSPGALHATAMSPPCARQATAALQVILGEDGTDRGARKLRELKANANWFRSQLRSLGCKVLGDEDSPVMPLMIYNPAKLPAFSRECLARRVAVVVVGFPATPLLLSRARICISAAHTRADLEAALAVIAEVADRVLLRYDVPRSILPLGHGVTKGAAEAPVAATNGGALHHRAGHGDPAAKDRRV